MSKYKSKLLYIDYYPDIHNHFKICMHFLIYRKSSIGIINISFTHQG
jgi:hypothetical protein